MNAVQVSSINEINSLTEQNPLVFIYFKMKGCSVCEVIKTKAYRMLEYEFPMVKLVEVEITSYPLISSHFSVLSAPTVLVLANQKEAVRKSGIFSIEELALVLKRIYKLIY